MSELFGRRYELQIDDLKITGLDVSFEVGKSLSARTPNHAEVRVFNLAASTRKKLQELDDVFVELRAGYEKGGLPVIFRGDLREAVSVREGTEWVTTINAGDGQKARKISRINRTFPPGTSVADVIVACGKALRIDMGNAQLQALRAKLRGSKSNRFANGYVATGDALSQLDRACRSCGIEWSIQDNELQLLVIGKPLEQAVVVLRADTGLVGSPERGSKGITHARCLMIPELYPGRSVKLDAQQLKGVYRIETTKHVGDTAAQDWYVELELKAA